MLSSFMTIMSEAPIKPELLIEMTKEIESQDLMTQISSFFPVIIDFSASWCGPCKQMKPILKEVAQEWSQKISFFVVDVDKFPELAQKFNIKSVPTFIVVVNGKEIGRCFGFQPKAQFQKQIEEILVPKDLSKLNKQELSEYLQKALASGTVEQVKKLVDAGADINAPLPNSLTPLSFVLSLSTMQSDSAEKLRILLELNVDLKFTVQGQTIEAIDFVQNQKKIFEAMASSLDKTINVLQNEMTKRENAPKN